MTPYFFDLRHDEGFVLDDEGLELPDFPAVQTEVAKAVAGAAPEALLRPVHPSEIAVEVRDSAGPVMNIHFNITVRIQRKN